MYGQFTRTGYTEIESSVAMEVLWPNYKMAQHIANAQVKRHQEEKTVTQLIGYYLKAAMSGAHSTSHLTQKVPQIITFLV